jgi:hypothetical protein
MNEALKFWLLALLALFGFWLLSGGYNSNLAKGRPFLRPFDFNNSYGSGSQIDLLPKGDFSFSNQSQTDQIKNAKDPQAIQREIDRISAEIKKAQDAATLSEYNGKIRLHIGNISGTDSRGEYLEVDTNQGFQSQVLITGWKLRSTVTGKEVVIGKGVLLPVTNQINSEDPIFIHAGDTIYINTGRSPIGLSFRTNLCTGYFTQFQAYNPSLRIDCPRPDSEALPYIDANNIDACQEYISNLNSCRIPVQLPTVSSIGYECFSYIRDKINYPTCITNHKNDVGFYKSDWRIFLGLDERLWKDRYETIELIDLRGKIVGTVAF